MVSKQDIVDIEDASVKALFQEFRPAQVVPHEPVPRVRASLDLIKSLPEFNGEMRAYTAWRAAAHFAMDFHLEGTDNHYVA